MASQALESSQYHHFIPQFILRNYAYTYQPPPSPKKGRRRRTKDKNTGLWPGDRAIDIIDLSTDAPELRASAVKRTFGIVDMYRDFTRPSDQQYLEKALGKLESKVSELIHRIRKNHDAGEQGVVISRVDRNMLRKFLFIMKYRGKSFHKRFTADGPGEYSSDDREVFLDYMREKGFQKPVDVWFMSIKVILELEMDNEGEWMKKLQEKMYPWDAQWYIYHTESFYLALCTPEANSREFILTDNAYNIYEGTTSLTIDAETGLETCTSWTSFHEFAPISPRLLIVLRSSLLPNPDEDKDPKMKKMREEWLRATNQSHNDPSTVQSFLADLPIRKASNSYSSISQQGIRLLPGEDGARRANHHFTFPFFKISTQDVDKINAVFFENAHQNLCIAFKSKDALVKSLEYFVSFLPAEGMKRVSTDVDDPRLAYLTKLEKVLHSHGSTAKLKYKQWPKLAYQPKEEWFASMTDLLVKHLPEKHTPFMELYIKLDGGPTTMVKDMDQVAKMVNLRIKIDVWTNGMPEAKREALRFELRDLFCAVIPIRRLWLYLIRLREMSLEPDPARLVLKLKEKEQNVNHQDEDWNQPEDRLIRETVKNKIRSNQFALLLYSTVMQDISYRKIYGSQYHRETELF